MPEEILKYADKYNLRNDNEHEFNKLIELLKRNTISDNKIVLIENYISLIHVGKP